jgi:hypothetical protein
MLPKMWSLNDENKGDGKLTYIAVHDLLIENQYNVDLLCSFPLGILLCNDQKTLDLSLSTKLCYVGFLFITLVLHISTRGGHHQVWFM